METVAKLLTVAEVAALTQLSKQGIWRLVRENVIPLGVRIHLGKHIRFDGDALQGWLAAGGHALTHTGERAR